MSKLESIKADLSLHDKSAWSGFARVAPEGGGAGTARHEKILFAAVAIMITLVGWTAVNYLVVKSWLLFMALLAIVGISIFIVYQYRIIKKLIKELIDV